MGLLTCPDCGNAVSDQAPACPKCGRPQVAAQATAPAAQVAAPAAPARRSTHPVALVIAIALLAGIGWYSLKSNQQSQLPLLPMVVKSRPAILGAGQVIIFENQTDQPLAVAATLGHPATNLQKVYQIYTGPRGSKSIGSAEGWIGQSGDTVALVNNNYQSWSGSLR
jgi:hypothetical protein